MQAYPIVLLEDDEDLGQMVVMMLGMKGHNVLPFLQIEDFWAHLEQNIPQLIITDMLLSGADGREICKELKAGEKTKDIKVLMMSAHPDAEVSCLDAGASAFVHKPFDMKCFVGKVNDLLDS